MPATTIPPFPDNVPIQELVIIDYSLIRQGDENEIASLWKAATVRGFWYLKNHGVEGLFEPMFDMGRETMSLPFEEKMKYWQGNQGASFGYKAAGATTVDLDGSKDNAEFINISKDDALAYPQVAHVAYPSSVNARMESTIRPFVEACMEINSTMLEVFNARLGLPEGALAQHHPREQYSVSEARCIRVPPSPGSTKIAVGAHTDFGSLSFLANRLGGLQVMLPGETEWKYVKPLPGHVICNVGDALNIFSGGILKSSIHRVLPPPLAQSHYERWSLVYFTRPGDSVALRALVDQSSTISEAVAKDTDRDYDPGVTAAQWFARRQSKWRGNNQKGSMEDYLASRGTEHNRAVV
ncbi:Clavaminate synthase-like protein [Collybia nuda]|uniref:Clavaminate synthase-like protein n=1 Tax=Collybia nuda TaxID=64659 RepID=A0A9P6CQ32_9AGAR|nr:Clavaminate synthase-like protein [Collybia nuda]